MKTPKTPVAFDYDLWTTEDGKCMVRVKKTGEVSEVNRDVMRVLRAEEKRIRRSYGSDSTSEDEDSAEKSSDSVLSLDAMPEDDVKSAAWLADSRDCMEAPEATSNCKFDTTSQSRLRRASIPTPFVPSGHFPLIGGNRSLKGEPPFGDAKKRGCWGAAAGGTILLCIRL